MRSKGALYSTVHHLSSVPNPTFMPYSGEAKSSASPCVRALKQEGSSPQD